MTSAVFSRRNVLRLMRDGIIFLGLLLLIEAWQARHLPVGTLPVTLDTLPSLSSGQATLAHDRITLLYVFAPWCTVCQYSAPNLNRLRQYAVNVEALALSWQETAEVKRFVETSELLVPVRLGREYEEDALQISAYPTYFLISPRGEILKAWTGYTTTVGLYGRVLWSQIFYGS